MIGNRIGRQTRTGTSNHCNAGHWKPQASTKPQCVSLTCKVGTQELVHPRLLHEAGMACPVGAGLLLVLLLEDAHRVGLALGRPQLRLAGCAGATPPRPSEEALATAGAGRGGGDHLQWRCTRAFCCVIKQLCMSSGRQLQQTVDRLLVCIAAASMNPPPL